MECVRIAVTGPRITDDRAVAKTLTTWLGGAMYADPESGTALPTLEALADTLSRRYAAGNVAGAGRQGWSLERTAMLPVNDRAVPFVTATARRFDYLGGAHPSTTVTAQTFRVDDGRPLVMDDVLTGDYETLLHTLAQTAFRAVRRIPDSMSFSDAGFFDDGTFRLARTWMLSTEGIEFYYNAYEVASYAQGPTEITVPWTALDGYRAAFIDAWWTRRRH